MAISVQSSLHRASKFARSGQLDLAEDEYQTLLSRYSANQRAKAGLKKLRQLNIGAKLPSRHNLAEVADLLEQGKPRQALVVARALVARFPTHAMAHNLLGVCCAAGPDPKTAIAHYQRALTLKPEDSDTAYNLGKEYYDSGDYPRAIAHYQTARALTPDCADTALSLGNAYFNNGQIDQAIEALEAATSLRPAFSVALNNLGAVLRAVGRLAEAQGARATRLHRSPLKPKHPQKLSAR